MYTSACCAGARRQIATQTGTLAQVIESLNHCVKSPEVQNVHVCRRALLSKSEVPEGHEEIAEEQKSYAQTEHLDYPRRPSDEEAGHVAMAAHASAKHNPFSPHSGPLV